PPPTATYTLSLHDALPIYEPDLERAERRGDHDAALVGELGEAEDRQERRVLERDDELVDEVRRHDLERLRHHDAAHRRAPAEAEDRKSTRLNSSHVKISYA